MYPEDLVSLARFQFLMLFAPAATHKKKDLKPILIVCEYNSIIQYDVMRGDKQ